AAITSAALGCSLTQAGSLHLSTAGAEQHLAQFNLLELFGRCDHAFRQLHTEVEAHWNAGRDPSQQGVVGGDRATRRQRGWIDLQEEVATALPRSTGDAGEVIATVLIGLDQQPFDSRYAHTGDAVFVDTGIADHIVHAIAISDLRDSSR